MRKKITIGTRASALAMVQTRWVADSLRAANPDLEIDLKQITSKGDTITQVPLARIGGIGLFTKELEVAILDGKVDMAVHSLKDLPVELPPGLALACVPPRETINDALIVRDGPAAIEKLPREATVGTSSIRRQAQLLAVRPDLRIADIRGNVDTRLRKLGDGNYSAIILARAGLNRLGLDIPFSHADIPLDVMLPAPGQGALALETREDDGQLRDLLAALNDADAAITSGTERRLLLLMGGGCSIPLGTHARCEGDEIALDAAVCSPDGTKIVRASARGRREDWKKVAGDVYEELMKSGAGEILKSLQSE